ncbi:MAG: hypothetical protein IPO41_07250 [Acidobacteria bacterium]|nr:hypothetical protein [Acidobacteriota bacterium]
MEFESEDRIFQFGVLAKGADMFKGISTDGKEYFWTEFYSVFDNLSDEDGPEGADIACDSFELAISRAFPGIDLL